MKLIKKITLTLGLFISTVAVAQNTTCANMDPICTDAGLSFTASSNGPSAEAGNAYGCLSSQPNPTWYYFEIATSGNIEMSLFAPSDIDFIIWGPFADLATAQASCGSMGNAAAPQVDCSYSGTNNETPSIPNAQVGETYVMLITNYANQIQDVTLTQTSGTGATDCNIVQPDPCVSNPGTFIQKKDGIITALPLYLCEGESFTIQSNQDFILPNDTIAAPIGDGIYTAQLMWLVYNAPPVSNDPTTDPGFLGNNFMIPSDDLNGSNLATDPLFQALGGTCGTYYFVPVAGDDGQGSGANDNGGLHWDKDGNGCFLFGDAIPVTFACPMVVTPVVNCNPLNNGMDIGITGGSGDYTIVNQGAGNLVNTNVLNGNAAQIENLTNNQGWEIDITDNAGCTANAQGVFAAPTIANITFNPAASCPVGSDGDVVTNLGASGASPYVVDMNANLNVAGPNYTFAGPAGTAVAILVTDANGCVFDSTVTITSAGHFINTSLVAQSDEACFGDGNGSATITALPVDAAGVQDGNIVSIVWTDPLGGTIPGGASNTSQTGMMIGNWSVTITDDIGCDVTIPITIGGPQELDVYATVNDGLNCFEDGSGDVTVSITGGVFSGNPVYTWTSNDGLNTNLGSISGATANALNAGFIEVFVTDDNGCMDSIDIEVIQPDEITAWITLKDVLCYGQSTGTIIIDSVTNNAGNVDYIWNLVTQPNPPTTSNIASGLPVGTYEFKIKDQNDCENQYSVTITQNDSIYFSELDFDSSICRNQIPFDNGQGVVVAAAARGGNGTGGSNFTYTWTEDATGATTTQTTWPGRDPGFYTILVVDDFGCTLSETIYLDSLKPNSDFTITFAQGEPQCVGPAVELVDFTNNSMNYAFSQDPNADTTFIWQFSIDGDTSLIITSDINENVQYPYSSEGLYTVCLTVIENLNGCEDSICKTIQIYDCPSLDIPNVFTPGAVGSSGDDVNDNFFFPNVAIIEFECTVYDRWGKKVFEFTDINQSWDGNNMNNDKPCSDGVYFYVYSGDSSNGTHYEGQGNVHLIRE